MRNNFGLIPANIKGNNSTILSFLLIFLFIFIFIFISAKFFRLSNFQTMAFQLPELGLLSFAMMIPLLAGGINLSIIATANLSGIVAALILSGGGHSPVILSFLAICAALFTSLVLGLINGILISFIGVSPILTTLGTMTIYQGMSLFLTGNSTISSFNSGFLAIGNETLLGIPISLLIFIVCAFILGFLLQKHKFGIQLYMIGTNEEVCSFSGIPVAWVKLKCYLLSGLLSGIAAIIMIARFNSAKAGYGSSYLLITILVSVLGGINPQGGEGKVINVILALVILQILSNLFNLLTINPFFTILIWGLLILVVLAAKRYIIIKKTKTEIFNG